MSDPDLREAGRAVFDALEKRGWTKHPERDDNGLICLGQAIYALHSLIEREALVDHVSNLIQRNNPGLVGAASYGRFGTIVKWNDLPETTKEDVYALVREAAGL